MKKLRKATKIWKCPPKKIPEWFCITAIDPIRFMKMLWSISALWCCHIRNKQTVLNCRKPTRNKQTVINCRRTNRNNQTVLNCKRTNRSKQTVLNCRGPTGTNKHCFIARVPSGRNIALLQKGPTETHTHWFIVVSDRYFVCQLTWHSRPLFIIYMFHLCERI